MEGNHRLEGILQDQARQAIVTTLTTASFKLVTLDMVVTQFSPQLRNCRMGARILEMSSGVFK